MIGYLLIDGRKFIPYKEKYRVFLDKMECLDEAHKLGFGSGMLGDLFPLGNTPGIAVQETGGGVDVTMIPIEIQERKP